MDDAPPDVQELAAERAARRAARDFAAADALRDRIAERGLDGRRRPEGWRLEPIVVDVVPAGPVAARDVVSVLDEPATADASIHWVVEGWPQDVRRAIDSFRAHAGDRDVHYVVADVTGEPATTWGRRRGGRAARARHRMGRRPQRRTQAVARPRRPGHGRLGRGDGRRARPARGRARGSPRRRLRTVRHRHARPPRVRQHGRPGGRRDRGLLHGVPARDPHDGRAVRREVPLVPDRRHRVLVPRQGYWGCAPWSFRCRSSATSTGCGSRRRPRTEPGGPSGTSTGSSIDGATGTT